MIYANFFVILQHETKRREFYVPLGAQFHMGIADGRGARFSEIVHYAKNEIIHHAGDDSSYAWMLLRGKVRIYKEGVGQRQQIIRLLKPYDIFGYRACIAGEPYNSSANAFEDCVVYRLPRESFQQLVRSNGTFCYEIMLTMAKDLAISEIQTVNLTQKHIRGRLAESLLLRHPHTQPICPRRTRRHQRTTYSEFE